VIYKDTTSQKIRVAAPWYLWWRRELQLHLTSNSQHLYRQ